MHDDRDLIERDIEAYLGQHQRKELLRFVAVGSVDDGKSTLIGRLLHDTHGLYEDQLRAVKRASSQKNLDIDFSLFTDGLKAEREQGITIDVAYRYFSTAKRKFIIADTPGHVQYTRNMATGASTANVGIILIDARLGVLQQSRRHAYIASLLGIPHLAVAVNKMDLKDYDQSVYEAIRAEFGAFARNLGFADVTFVPISALAGDNVVHPSQAMPWYEGGTLLQYLETVPIASDRNLEDFRYPVQYVLRPDLDYRGFSGQIASGVVRRGDPVLVLPSRRKSRIKAVDSFGGELEEAFAPMSVTLRLEDEVDVSRGDMLVHPDNVPHVSRQLEAMLVWLSDRPMQRDRSYFLKHTTQLVRTDVEDVLYQVDLDTLERVPAQSMALNDIGKVRLRCHRPIFFDAYAKNRSTGAFVLVDPITNDTVAAGMLVEPDAIPAGQTMPPEGPARSSVPPEERHLRLHQRGAVVWLTGLPACGKSEIAYALERRLFDVGRVAVVIDPHDEAAAGEPSGPAVAEHVGLLARRLADGGLVAVFAYGSPRAGDRDAIRTRVGPDRFVEVFVATSRERCEARDRRSAYAAGSPPEHEAPSAPAATVSLDDGDPYRAAERILRVLEERGFFLELES